MHPILFEYGVLKIHSFGVMLLIAFFAGLWLAKARAAKLGLPPEGVGDMLFWTLIAGVLGARIAYIIQHVPDYAGHWDRLLTLQFQGLTSFGGVILGGALAIVWARRAKWSVRTMLDVLAPAFILGHIIGRFGCLLNGCCYGAKCELPWAIHIHDLEGRYHPAQVYDSAMNMVVLFAVLQIERRGHFRPGQLFGLVLALHGVTRIVYEVWRAGASSEYLAGSMFTVAQLAALILSLVGVACFFAFSRGRSQVTEQTA
ncbi:MAG: prolipoprotein diacylglyceryl transferase [Fimbriimonas sp.]